MLYPLHQGTLVAFGLCTSVCLGLGCVLPPDPDRALAFNGPPAVDLSTQRPPRAITAIRPSCRLFRAEVRVRDPDSPFVAFRWVANNGTNRRRLLLDDDPRPTTPAGLQGIRAALATTPEHYQVDLGAQSGALSLFITDAVEADPTTGLRPLWAVADPGRTTPEEAPDLGGIVVRDDEVPDHVVEVRWVFEFREAGECVE